MKKGLRPAIRINSNLRGKREVMRFVAHSPILHRGAIVFYLQNLRFNRIMAGMMYAGNPVAGIPDIPRPSQPITIISQSWLIDISDSISEM